MPSGALMMLYVRSDIFQRTRRQASATHSVVATQLVNVHEQTVD